MDTAHRVRFTLPVSYWHRYLQLTLIISVDILRTCCGSLFNSELVHQGELIDRCNFFAGLDEYIRKVHNNYIGC